VDGCEVVEVRTQDDAEGYACDRRAVARCADCGTAVCGSHAGRCEWCGETFCLGCTPFHRSAHAKPAQPDQPEKPARKSAQDSGAASWESFPLVGSGPTHLSPIPALTDTRGERYGHKDL